MKTKKGMSLPEVLISVIFFAFVITVILAIFSNTKNLLNLADLHSTLQRNARNSIRKISSELQKSDVAYINIQQSVPVIGSDSITYRLLRDTDNDNIPDQTSEGEPDWDNGYDVTISLDSTAHTLIRTVGANDTVIAWNVKTVNFFDHVTTPALPIDEVRMSVEFETSERGKVYNFDLTSVIKVRN